MMSLSISGVRSPFLYLLSADGDKPHLSAISLFVQPVALQYESRTDANDMTAAFFALLKTKFQL